MDGTTVTSLQCSYVIYIAGNASDVWSALTDADSTGAWWGHSNISDWKVGSTWKHVRADGSDEVDGVGEVLESVRPNRLAMTFPTPKPSTVAFDLEEFTDSVRLTMTHTELDDEATCSGVARVWPALLSNLKTYLESGKVMATSPLSTL